MQSYFLGFDFFSQNTKKINQTLKTLRPTIHSTRHDQIKFYCLFSSFPLHTAKIEGGGGGQDRDEYGSQIKYR